MGIIALYMRLSSEDANEGESCSITNQRDLLYDYVRSRREFDSSHVMEFCDDGYSGTNFDRPAVKELLSLAGSTVKCIIVKDFSRFGRNLVEVGDYLDQIFPFLGVRFIAVNEGYDSGQGIGSTVSLDVSLKAMVYEMYSRDISEKIRCVQQAKMRKGEYLCAIAFYGYKRSETVKNKLEVDEPAARVVRRIFNMAAGGLSPTEIAAALNHEGIPSPLMYRKANNTHGLRGWTAVNDTNYWTRENVKRIVTDERYTGCLISRKRTKVDVSTKRTQALPQRDWIVAKDTHEAIVSKENFGKAQEVIRSVSPNKPSRKPYQKFRGLVKCACCGRALTRIYCKKPYYSCPTRKAVPESSCAGIHLDEQDLEKTLLTAIRAQVQLMVQSADPKQKGPTAVPLQESIRECQALLSRYKAIQTAAFEDYAEGRIDKQEYLSRKQEVNRGQEETDKQLALLLEQSAMAQGKAACPVSDLGRYAFVEELKREMLEELVREVRVSGADRMEIVWNFKE